MDLWFAITFVEANIIINIMIDEQIVKIISCFAPILIKPCKALLE